MWQSGIGEKVSKSGYTPPDISSPTTFMGDNSDGSNDPGSNDSCDGREPSYQWPQGELDSYTDANCEEMVHCDCCGLWQ